MPNGKLFIVSTPIGNLSDFSSRAFDTLSSSDIIACEDTRHTGLFLSKIGIKKRLVCYNDTNEKIISEKLLSHLLSGETISVVSDAGTPGISDPAYRIVKLAVDNGIDIFPVPGASAILSALVVSGLPCDKFVFEGFLPNKGQKRKERLISLASETRTLILYESPYRIYRLLDEILAIFGDRDISLSRELTKVFEETVRGPVSSVIDKLKSVKPRGEYTVVIGGFEKKKSE